MADIGSAIGDLGGAVSDLFGAEGSSQAAGAYDTAAKIAQQNEKITEASTAIQETQQGIATYKALGTENADVAAAGFANSGSALDLLRASTSQASLSKALIETQGEITEKGYEEQAAAYQGQAQAAQTQSQGQTAGGILSGIGGVVSGILSWVICSELVKQGRMPRRYWMPGAAVFASYPEAVREGYFVWAVPSVRHLRAHPNSLYSRCLEAVFNWRAENIAAHRDVRGARKLVRGAAVTVVLWPLCYAIGAVRLALKRTTDWKGLYRA